MIYHLDCGSKKNLFLLNHRLYKNLYLFLRYLRGVKRFRAKNTVNT